MRTSVPSGSGWSPGLPFPLLIQGTAPRHVLLREFKTTRGAVLLATASFWQGVDVAGDALSCVVIDKLPFASPRDPITAARMEAIAARGGDPFDEYQVPLAILTLLQGLGRLIRHRRDRGVLALLDPRVRTRGYGRRFLASLPPAPATQDAVRRPALPRGWIGRRGLAAGSREILRPLPAPFSSPETLVDWQRRRGEFPGLNGRQKGTLTMRNAVASFVGRAGVVAICGDHRGAEPPARARVEPAGHVHGAHPADPGAELLELPWRGSAALRARPPDTGGRARGRDQGTGAGPGPSRGQPSVSRRWPGWTRPPCRWAATRSPTLRSRRFARGSTTGPTGIREARRPPPTPSRPGEQRAAPERPGLLGVPAAGAGAQSRLSDDTSTRSTASSTRHERTPASRRRPRPTG